MARQRCQSSYAQCPGGQGHSLSLLLTVTPERIVENFSWPNPLRSPSSSQVQSSHTVEDVGGVETLMLALTCRWRSRPQHQKRTLAELLDHLVGGSARVQTKPHFT